MNRRELLRNGGAALTTTAVIGLSGCSGDGGNGGDGNGGSSGGSSSTIQGEGEIGGALEEKLAFASHEGTFGDGTLTVTAQVKNAGAEPTDPSKYNYLVMLQGQNSLLGQKEIEGIQSTDDGKTAPGDTGEIEIAVALEETKPSDVKSYKLSVHCSRDVEGVYCQA